MSEVLIASPEITLGKTLIDALVDGLTPLTALGFMYDVPRKFEMRELARDVRRHIVPVERLRIVSKDNQPIAFIAAETQQTQFGSMYHLGGVIIHPDYQGNGLAKNLLIDEIAQTGAKLLAFHTQSRDMLALGEKLAEMSLSLSSGLAEEIGTPDPDPIMLGDKARVVHHGRYNGKNLYHNLSRFREEGKPIEGLNYLMGDAIVFVGEILPPYAFSEESLRYE